MPLSAKTVQDRTVTMAENVTRQQIEGINSALPYAIACDASKDKNDIEQIALFCRYVSAARPQEEIIELIPVKGQMLADNIRIRLDFYLLNKRSTGDCIFHSVRVG